MTFERRYRTVSARLFTLALIASACLVGGCASSPLFTTHLQADEPASSYTRILRAAAAVRQSGDVAAASMLYERAHQLNPEDAAPLLALGEIAASAGSAVQAARTLREALRRAPNDINARGGSTATPCSRLMLRRRQQSSSGMCSESSRRTRAR